MAKNVDIYEALKTSTDEEGMVSVFVDNPTGELFPCDYWYVGGEGDQWRYHLSGAAGPRFSYSHPNEQGCMIAIKRHFVDVGLIKVPLDNSHLDDKNQLIAAEILTKWNARTGRPRVGDFLRLPDGIMKRFCNDVGEGQQTTNGGSFSISNSGRVSYSGGLDSPILWERFKPTNETINGRFWFFSHNRAGAGRGVDVFLPCRVYDLADVTMTHEDAGLNRQDRLSGDLA